MAPPGTRYDRVPVAAGLKLETRGVTPQSAAPEERATKQRLFSFEKELLRDTICHKLSLIDRLDLTEGMADCHTRKIVKECVGCKKASVFQNRCETKFCPICAPRLARERRESVEWWVKQISQPKHIVLTARNSDTITRKRVLDFKEAFSKLRRSKLSRNWTGGFYSLEVTNEGRGWHLHMHVLVNARFVPADQLAEKWGKLMGQDFAIVKVKDCRENQYLHEVTKYAVKGTEMASWSPEDIAAMLDAFDNVRLFGVFGDLFTKRAAFQEYLDTLQGEPEVCECGCAHFRTMDENEYDWEVIRRELDAGPAAPPKCEVSPPLNNLEFAFAKVTQSRVHVW